jgi:translation initiation factor 3 subunit B
VYEVRKLKAPKEVRQQNVFNVERCDLHWQSQGDMLAAVAVIKGKTTLTSFNVFRLRERNVPVETLELPEKVLKFAWEPSTTRFAVSHTEHASGKGLCSVSFYSVESAIQLLRKVEKKPANALYWSPRGNTILLADMVATNGAVEFYNAHDYEVMAIAEHFSATSIEWDPSGRYVAIISARGRSANVESSYSIYHLTGELVQKVVKQKLMLFSWRPRPNTLLTKDALQRLKNKLSDYFSRFAQEERHQVDAVAEAERSRRSNDVALFNQRLSRRVDEYRSESRARRDLRGGAFSDTEDDFLVTEEIVISEEVINVREEIVKP